MYLGRGKCVMLRINFAQLWCLGNEVIAFALHSLALIYSDEYESKSADYRSIVYK